MRDRRPAAPSGAPRCQPVKMFHFWFNTFFIKNEELVLRKEEVDKANKDKKCKVYDRGFMVEIQFARLDATGSEIAGRPRSALFVSPGESDKDKYEPPSAMRMLQEQMYVRAVHLVSARRCRTLRDRRLLAASACLAGSRRMAGIPDVNAASLASPSSGDLNDIPAEVDENLSDDEDDADGQDE